MIRVQIQDEADCVLFYAKALVIGMVPSILSTAKV